MINLSDRIKEISYSTGTGDFILGGAFTGFSNFGSAYSYGAILYYAISDGTNYEIGSGEYLFSAPNRLLRRYPFKSTNSNNKVNFPAGTKEVYVTYPGEKAVFTAANLSDFSSPQNSGVAFWRSNQILDYDTNLTWDYNNNRLGVSNSAPQYSIDVGGRNFIRSSGFIVGASGVTFPQQDLVYSGGVQKEPFLRNQTDVTTGTNLVFGWSGLVSETLTFKKQSCKTFLAGPSGCLQYDYPTFRPLYVEDVPDLSSLYVTQTGTGGAGQVAFYENNRVIGYDSFFVWDKNNNYLGVNRQNPTRSLDVNGNAIVNGYLDVNSLNTSGQIFFSSGNTPPAGTMRWDNGEGTVALGLKGGEIELEIGQEQVALCYNGTGSNISKGKVVYIVGAQGQKPSIALASNSGEITSSKTFGIVAENIDAGQEGFVATYGVVRNINTDNFIEGSGLWLDTNGNMTMTRPTQPAHGVHIGYVMKKSASAGRVFVRVQNGFELDEIHNVLISSVASGDLLQYDSSSQLWKNRSSQSIQYATGSGLTLVGNTLHTAGSGNFRYISFGDDKSNVHIQTNGPQFTPSQKRIISVGPLAGANINPGLHDINMGFAAGYAVNGYFNVNIGPNRTAAQSTNQVSVNIGGLAGEYVSVGGYDNNIGYMAGQYAIKSQQNNNIGAFSNIGGSGFNNNNIGAATLALGDINNNIGPYNRSIGNVNNLIGYFNISSGNYNNIVGFEIVNSGNYNIAIGSGISIVANNRLNLGKTIAGHLESGRIYIGSVTDTNLFPRSTLELIPKSANDKVLIVNAHSSQSANLQDWNNRFGTTITFVDSSGIINANSGIILTPGTPSVTTNRIYNVGGALYFNGAALAGGYTSWTISDSGGNSESVTNGTNIIFSGANGVATVYNPTTNVMMVSGTNLGGGGSYNWRIADSGGAADTIANNELVIFSGVNGIGTIYNPTTNVMVLSGINPYSSWTLADSGGNSKNIINNTQVIFSGVNGVATVYNPVANTMMVSGTQNAFSTISIAGQSDVVADSITDTLTLIAGTNITLSTNASQDSITINSTAGGGGSYDWRIADSGGVPDTIISGDLVMFSGANGIATIYNASNNVMTVSGAYTAGSGIILTGNQISLSGNNIISSSGFASSAFIQTSGAFITQDSSFTLSGIHNGKTIRSSGNSQINVTVSGNLPIGFGVSFIQTGPASIFYSGAPGVTIRNRQGHTKSAGLWSVTSLIEYSDNIFVLTGDTGT